MGTLHVSCKVENHVDRSRSARIPKILVDTGSEYTWLPAPTLKRIGVAQEKKDLAFVMANGQVVTRSVGFAVVRVGKHFTIDEVVFAEKGDLIILGAHTLEGLNLVVDAARKRLVAGGPIPAAYTEKRPRNANITDCLAAKSVMSPFLLCLLLHSRDRGQVHCTEGRFHGRSF